MKIINIEQYGESHGESIGIILTNIPHGKFVNIKDIERAISKRQITSSFNTNRHEANDLTISSGIFEGKTTGAPINIMINNGNFNSTDYDRGIIRPSHVDYAAFNTYQDSYDYRGSGCFSGRLTAVYVAAGELCRQVLDNNIQVKTQISRVGPYTDDNLEDNFSVELDPILPICNDEIKDKVTTFLDEISTDFDSIGGSTRTVIENIPAGLGGYFKDNLESNISYLMFQIPGVKAIEFGSGVNFARQKGSESLDSITLNFDKAIMDNNHNGGILGGISHGLKPIVFQLTFKPPASIFKEIDTIRYTNGLLTKEKLNLKGRHDSFYVNRAIPAVEGMCYIVMLDSILHHIKRGV